MAIDPVQIRADPFLHLLTDALRDGPGSPAWHQAIQQLNDAPASAVEEYRLLCRAREHLESGKDFRAIRPGPGFTSRVMAGIEAGERKRYFWNTGRIIAGLSALFVVLAIGLTMWHVFPHGAIEDPDVTALSNTLFGTPLVALDVEGHSFTGWRQIGNLPLRFSDGLQVQKPGRNQSLPVGGGLALGYEIAADLPFVVDARFQVAHFSDDLVPEIAISDTNDFNQTGTSSHELVWALQGRAAKVILPGGRLGAQNDFRGDARSDVAVRIRINLRAAIIEMNGHTIWSGEPGLSPTRSRLVVLRMIRRGQPNQEGVSLRSLRVLTAR